jgi:hypothetical protein
MPSVRGDSLNGSENEALVLAHDLYEIAICRQINELEDVCSGRQYLSGNLYRVAEGDYGFPVPVVGPGTGAKRSAEYCGTYCKLQRSDTSHVSALLFKLTGGKSAPFASAVGIRKIPGRDYEQHTAEKKQYRNRSTLVHDFF